MAEWLRCFRIAWRDDIVEARPAKREETFKSQTGISRTIPAGYWVCRNPLNGYIWVASQEDFDYLYCEVGKVPKKIKKKRGSRKKKKNDTLSWEEEGHYGSLFNETE